MKMVWLAALMVLIPAAAFAQVESNPDLGKAESQCRPNEAGSAVIVTVVGLKDRRGTLRAELYPDNDQDFLQDDNILINQGKTFRRVEMPLPQAGALQLCVRTPGPGAYTLSLLHDRDSNRKFGLSKPRAAATRFQTGPGLTQISIRLNYRRGLFSFGPLRDGD